MRCNRPDHSRLQHFSSLLLNAIEGTETKIQFHGNLELDYAKYPLQHLNQDEPVEKSPGKTPSPGLKGERVMPIPRQISDYLDSQHVWYRTSVHPLAYTAQGLAHVQHISGRLLAKSVMVNADQRMVMAVLPASHRIDFAKLQALLNAASLRLATEDEFKDIFPDCELGAMPPFGNLYHIEVWVDAAMQEHPNLLFNAGTHLETIEMSFMDFEKLVHPKIGIFSELRH